jgi:hypothetical protein
VEVYYRWLFLVRCGFARIAVNTTVAQTVFLLWRPPSFLAFGRGKICEVAVNKASGSPEWRKIKWHWAHSLVPLLVSACSFFSVPSALVSVVVTALVLLTNTARRYLAVPALALAGIALATLLETDYIVECAAVVESADARIVSTPFDSTLRSVHVKVGDAVRQGDLLGVLDTRELELQLEHLSAERKARALREMQARVDGSLADMQVLGAQIAQIDAQVEWVRERVEQGKLVAPIDGVILAVGPDAIPGPGVAGGRLLFRVGSAKDLQIAIDIPAPDAWRTRQALELAKDNRTQLRGRVSFVAHPDAVDFAIERLESREEATVAIGRIAGESRGLHPNMSGVARVGVGRISYFGLCHRKLANLAW